AQTRLRNTLDARDRALPGRAELQLDHELLADLGVLHGPPRDVALLLEDLGDVRLDLRVRHRHGVVVCRIRVAQTRQHVCDRVGHRHGLLALLAAGSRDRRSLDLRRGQGAPSPGARSVITGGARPREPVPGRRSPAGLRDAGQLAAVSHLPEAHAAQPELPVDGTRTAAARASSVRAHLELRLPRRLGDQRLLRHALLAQLSLKGKPRSLSSARPSSSFFAVVTIVMSMPRWRSTLSGSTSWNMTCSVSPKV